MLAHESLCGRVAIQGTKKTPAYLSTTVVHRNEPKRAQHPGNTPCRPPFRTRNANHRALTQSPDGQGLKVGLRQMRVEFISSSFLIVALVLMTISPSARGIRITIALNPDHCEGVSSKRFRFGSRKSVLHDKIGPEAEPENTAKKN